MKFTLLLFDWVMGSGSGDRKIMIGQESMYLRVRRPMDSALKSGVTRGSLLCILQG